MEREGEGRVHIGGVGGRQRGKKKRDRAAGEWDKTNQTHKTDHCDWCIKLDLVLNATGAVTLTRTLSLPPGRMTRL